MMTGRSLFRLKLLTVLAPLCYIMAAEFFQNIYLRGKLPDYQSTLIIFVSTLAAALVFSEIVFGILARMEYLLHQQRKRIEAIFHHTSDAVILLDDADTVVAMNPAGHRLTGYAPETVAQGMAKARSLFAVPSGEAAWWGQARVKGQVPYFEAVVKSSAGVEIPVTGSATAIPAPEAGGQVALIMRDMSEKKALEAEVERRRRQAEGLYDIGLELASLVDLEDKLKDVLEKVKTTVGVNLAGWAFVDEATGEIQWNLLSCDGCGFSPRRPDELCSMLAGGVPDALDALVRECIVDRLSAESSITCLLVSAVPVMAHGRAMGALLVGCGESYRPSVFDMIFLSSVATQAALALENMELYTHGQGQAILEERERVAKEMHDGFGQTLTYLTAMVATMEQLLRRDKVEEAMAKLADTRKMLGEAHQEVRMAIFHLRQETSGEDLLSQTRGLVDQFSRQSGIETDLVVEGASRVDLPFEKGIQVVRIIQEALANVRKHAGAAHVTVRINRFENTLEISVEDDGRGFDPSTVLETGQNFGLYIMEERTQAVGGDLKIASAAGKGARITLRVPMTRWSQARVG